MENYMEQMVLFLTKYGLNIIGAIIILILGRIAAGIGRRLIEKLMGRSKVDPSVTSFCGSLVYFGILAFTVLAALAKFGIQTASFIAVIGAAGLAVGLALQGSLANFAAGVLILILHPFKTGHYIEAGGVAGTVKDIQMFTTTLATPDNIKILVPNGKILNDVIKNISGYDTRRIDLVIGIGYGSDIEKAWQILEKIIQSDDRILKEPAYTIAVSELADSSVNFVVRPWVNSADYWATRFDLIKTIKQSFDENDIEIPFPQVTVHKG
ncbi:mechanosensitive ion channel family protein [Desulfotignum balticum]|jgi:small conductance mechanosensitive channel|uniref:mechanosensitive ion channel family protein n=1 Tax=Desulfotignum balticum TaxID=115781 RepID=UPI000412EBAC|nr:mechanosensitive ion channel domain-containing protein [Desulfotignum balticum]